MSNTKEYLTPAEVAQKLRINQITVYRMIKRGELPAAKMGRVWRINSKKLEELFDQYKH